MPADPKTARLQREFSQDFDLFLVLTNDLKLATLHELQTIYNTEDFYDMLEIIEVDRELRAIAEARAKLEQATNN